MILASIPHYKETLQLITNKILFHKKLGVGKLLCVSYRPVVYNSRNPKNWKSQSCIYNQGGLNKNEQQNHCNMFSILIFNEFYLFA